MLVIKMGCQHIQYPLCISHAACDMQHMICRKTMNLFLVLFAYKKLYWSFFWDLTPKDINHELKPRIPGHIIS